MGCRTKPGAGRGTMKNHASSDTGVAGRGRYNLCLDSMRAIRRVQARCPSVAIERKRIPSGAVGRYRLYIVTRHMGLSLLKSAFS